MNRNSCLRVRQWKYGNCSAKLGLWKFLVGHEDVNFHGPNVYENLNVNFTDCIGSNLAKIIVNNPQILTSCFSWDLNTKKHHQVPHQNHRWRTIISCRVCNYQAYYLDSWSTLLFSRRQIAEPVLITWLSLTYTPTLISYSSNDLT